MSHQLIPSSAKNNTYMKKSLLPIVFVLLAIVAVIYITRQQRERFDADPVLANMLVEPNIRLSKIQKRQEKAQDAINAGAGKAGINGIM